MFSSLFSNSGSREYIGISLNANGLLEVIQTSKSGSEIQKYTNRFVNYNAITREVESYETLGAEIESALSELNINAKNCAATISLPNVLFGITELPEILSDEEISNALISEVEDSYIFKRQEPAISWCKISTTENTSKIAYSALQTSVLKEIKEICSGLGITLLAVQNSISELLTGLSFSELTSKVIPTDKSAWNLLLISGTSYSIFNFLGDKLNNYYEEPLAVKSFTDEEVYAAVGSMASTALQNYPATNLLIISETDEVSAEVISTKLSTNSIPFYIEQNKFQQQPSLKVSLNVLPGYIPQITIAAVGASVNPHENRAIKFNYLDSLGSSAGAGDIITIGDSTFEITKDLVTKITIYAIVFAAVVFGGTYFLLNTAISKTSKKINQLTQEETNLQNELKSFSDKPSTVNITGTIENITKSNRKKMLYYDALSYGIPEKLWIESFYAGSGDSIGINGVSLNSNDITAFLKGIREVAGESEVSVVRLTVTGSDDIVGGNEPELYSFTLANQAYKDTMNNSAVSGDNNNNTNPIPANQSQPNQNYGGNNIPPVDNPSTVPPVIPAE